MTKFDFTIDWLEFTYRAPEGECSTGEEVFIKFREVFPEFDHDWEKNADMVYLLGHGRNFYNTVFCFSDDYTVSYHSEKDKMGVHVTFPGRGIWKISDIFGFNDINEFEACKKLFQIFNERNCTITRLDIAYDDYTKTFTPKDFDLWMHQERIVTDCKAWKYETSQQSCGDTFYLGKRGRDRLLRVYDKNYESDGKIDAIRYEFELKDRWAKTVQHKVLNDEIFNFADFLDSMFTIKVDWGFSGNYAVSEHNNKYLNDLERKRKSLAEVDEKWQLFLETIRKTHESEIVLALPKEKEQYSLKRLDRWLNDYIAPSLYIYRSVVGNDAFSNMIDNIIWKLKPNQKAMIKKFQEEKDDYFDMLSQKLGNSLF